jgi:hypothetical protein
LADDHHLGDVVDEVDAGDLADFGGGLHVDDALATAGLEAVGSCREMLIAYQLLRKLLGTQRVNWPTDTTAYGGVSRPSGVQPYAQTPNNDLSSYGVPISPYGVPDLILWGTNLTLCVKPHPHPFPGLFWV